MADEVGEWPGFTTIVIAWMAAITRTRDPDPQISPACVFAGAVLWFYEGDSSVG